MATDITLVVNYTAPADDGKDPVLNSILIGGSALAAARTTLEKRQSWWAACKIQEQIVRLGLLPLGASADKIT